MAVAANNPLLNPNAPLTGPALLAAAQALAQTQTQPAISQLAAQMAQNDRQTQGALNATGGYFNQLGGQAQQGLAAERGIQSDLNQQLQGLQAQENQRLGQIGQGALESFSKYAPQSDAQHSLAQPALASLASEMARQKGLAAQQEGASAAFGARQGANYSGLAASNLGTFGLKGQEDLSRIAQSGQIRNEPLTSKIAALRAGEGALTATDLGKLRQQEVANQIAEKGLGIKQNALNVSAANNQRTNATQTANNQRTVAGAKANNALTNKTSAANNAATNATSTANNIRTNTTSAANNAANNATRTAVANGRTGAGATKPLTPQQNNAQLTDLNRIQSAIRTWQQTGIKDKTGKVIEPHPTDAQMRQVLGGSTYNPVLVQAAFELLGYGYITRQTAANMHNAGIRGGTFNNKPIQVQSQIASTVTGVGNQVSGALSGLF